VARAAKSKDVPIEQCQSVIEATRGMFAHLAPGVSLADGLLADRRAEVRAEEAAEVDRVQAEARSIR
jgi:hypothetical protein